MRRTPGSLMPDRFQETDRGESEIMEIQMGPSHPASHGTIKFNLQLDGETIVDVDVEIGYLHRGFEKMCEQGTWNHCFPYADRLNYASPAPEQRRLRARGRAAGRHRRRPSAAQYIRVIVGEISRITDHLTCLGMAAQRGRRHLGRLLPDRGARVPLRPRRGHHRRPPHGHVLPAGRRHERPAGRHATTASAHAFASLRGILADCDAAALAQPHLRRPHGGRRRDQREGRRLVGPHRPAAPRDRRGRTTCARPSPTWSTTASTSRSRRARAATTTIASWCASPRCSRACASSSRRWRRFPTGPIMANDPRFVLPPKQEVYGSIEGLMNHFKLVIEGQKVPAGEVYVATEGGNGELGFYLVSDGSGRPYRVRVRPPCFYAMARARRHAEGRHDRRHHHDVRPDQHDRRRV